MKNRILIDMTLGCSLRAESPGRGDTAINISQQILPVNQLKVNIPSRDRSRSETELDNIFADPMKVVSVLSLSFSLSYNCI